MFQKNLALIFSLFFESRRVQFDYGKEIDQSPRVDVKKTAGKSTLSFSGIGEFDFEI